MVHTKSGEIAEGPFNQHGLTDTRACICNHIQLLMWDAIIYICAKKSFDQIFIQIRTWMSNYIPQIFIYLVTYPCPTPNLFN